MALMRKDRLNIPISSQNWRNSKFTGRMIPRSKVFKLVKGITSRSVC